MCTKQSPLPPSMRPDRTRGRRLNIRCLSNPWLSIRWLSARRLGILCLSGLTLTLSACAGTSADGAGDAGPDDEAVPFPSAWAETLDGLLADRYEAVDSPALALTVTVDGYAAYDGVHGLASVSPEDAVRLGDRFRIGSVTKSFTGAATVILAREGKLSLDDSADSIVPALQLDPAITVRMLLNHTAGLFNYTDDAAFLARSGDFATPEEIVAFAQEHEPEFSPGQGWSYSNTNYMVLGRILEQSAGQSLAEIFRSRLLDPAGLEETWLEGFEDGDRIVHGHLQWGDVTDQYDTSWSWAAGGLASSSGDLCRWLDEILRGDLLSAEERAEMLKPAELPGGDVVRYGFGLEEVPRGDFETIGHTGSTMGFKGLARMDPAAGVCVTLLTNDFFSAPNALSLDVWDAAASFE